MYTWRNKRGKEEEEEEEEDEEKEEKEEDSEPVRRKPIDRPEASVYRTALFIHQCPSENINSIKRNSLRHDTR